MEIHSPSSQAAKAVTPIKISQRTPAIFSTVLGISDVVTFTRKVNFAISINLDVAIEPKIDVGVHAVADYLALAERLKHFQMPFA